MIDLEAIRARHAALVKVYEKHLDALPQHLVDMGDLLELLRVECAAVLAPRPGRHGIYKSRLVSDWQVTE